MVTSFLFIEPLKDSNLITPFEHFLSQNRILLKTSGLTMCRGGSLDVPIAEAEFADGPKIAAARTEFAVE